MEEQLQSKGIKPSEEKADTELQDSAQKEQQHGSVVPTVTIAITKQFDITYVERQRDHFSAHLSSISLPDGTRRFPRQQVSALVSLFFDDIGGSKSLLHLANLIEVYNKRELTKKADNRATTYVPKTTLPLRIPPPIREFVNIYDRNDFHEQDFDQGLEWHKHERACLKQLQDIGNLLAFRKKHNDIIDLAAACDRRIMAFYKSFGQAQCRRSELIVAVTERLASTMRTDIHILWLMLDTADKIDVLVQTFGRGVIPLISVGSYDGFGKDLHYWDSKTICGIAERYTQPFKQVCDLVDEHVYQPYLEGANRIPLDVDTLKNASGGTLIDILQNAVQDYKHAG